MIKKFFIYIVLCILFTSCSTIDKSIKSIETESLTLDKTENDKEVQLEEVEVDVFPNDNYRNISTYRVAPSKIEINDQARPEGNKRWIRKMEVTYPRIYNFEDNNWEKENIINELIFNELENRYGLFSDKNYIDIDINYRLVEVNNDYLSILFYGYVHRAQRDSDVHLSVNVDIKNEKLMRLNEVIDDSIDLIELYHSGELVLIDDNAGLPDEIKYMELEEYNKRFERVIEKSNFYFDSEYIGLVLPANRGKSHLIFGLKKDDYWNYTY